MNVPLNHAVHSGHAIAIKPTDVVFNKREVNTKTDSLGCPRIDAKGCSVRTPAKRLMSAQPHNVLGQFRSEFVLSGGLPQQALIILPEGFPRIRRDA